MPEHANAGRGLMIVIEPGFAPLIRCASLVALLTERGRAEDPLVSAGTEISQEMFHGLFILSLIVVDG
jgi:hypothetical protein